jgi:hypothetical protein
MIGMGIEQLTEQGNSALEAAGKALASLNPEEAKVVVGKLRNSNEPRHTVTVEFSLPNFDYYTHAEEIEAKLIGDGLSGNLILYPCKAEIMMEFRPSYKDEGLVMGLIVEKKVDDYVLRFYFNDTAVTEAQVLDTQPNLMKTIHQYFKGLASNPKE